MRQILVYSDSLSWGIVPSTRKRQPFEARWPGVMELALHAQGQSVQVIEDCLNGRRIWEDPFKPGTQRTGGPGQSRINSPLDLVMLMLGTNDFQSMPAQCRTRRTRRAAWCAIRQAPISRAPIPPILVIVPPRILVPPGPVPPGFTAPRESAGW